MQHGFPAVLHLMKHPTNRTVMNIVLGIRLRTVDMSMPHQLVVPQRAFPININVQPPWA